LPEILVVLQHDVICFGHMIAVLGGTTFEMAGAFGEGLASSEGFFTVETPAGTSPPIHRLSYRSVPFFYVRFHGYSDHDRSDRISGLNFVRMFAALHSLGVTHAFGGATSGGIRASYELGDFVIPSDLLDFNKERPSNIWEASSLDRPSVRARFNPPFCPDMSQLLYDLASQHFPGRAHSGAVLVQTQPNRYETPAEIRMYRTLGGDLVTHNVGTEAIYARQMGIHFAALQSISNPAEGVRPFTIEEETATGASISRRAAPILLEAIVTLAHRQPTCGIICTGERFAGVVS
jgi:5'-methylthioadenosine phosphorylase